MPPELERSESAIGSTEHRSAPLDTARTSAGYHRTPLGPALGTTGHHSDQRWAPPDTGVTLAVRSGHHRASRSQQTDTSPVDPSGGVRDVCYRRGAIHSRLHSGVTGVKGFDLTRSPALGVGGGG